MRWKTTTPAVWFRDAESSSLQIIFETIDVTVRRGSEKVRERRDRDRVL